LNFPYHALPRAPSGSTAARFTHNHSAHNEHRAGKVPDEFRARYEGAATATVVNSNSVTQKEITP